eukprot:scaffold85163_cov61-Phaeocystis_antarctica.AAC.2
MKSITNQFRKVQHHAYRQRAEHGRSVPQAPRQQQHLPPFVDGQPNGKLDRTIAVAVAAPRRHRHDAARLKVNVELLRGGDHCKRWRSAKHVGKGRIRTEASVVPEARVSAVGRRAWVEPRIRAPLVRSRLGWVGEEPRPQFGVVAWRGHCVADREEARPAVPVAVRAEALLQQDGWRAPTHERVRLRADGAAQASTARADVRLD